MIYAEHGKEPNSLLTTYKIEFKLVLTNKSMDNAKFANPLILSIYTAGAIAMKATNFLLYSGLCDSIVKNVVVPIEYPM